MQSVCRTALITQLIETMAALAENVLSTCLSPATVVTNLRHCSGCGARKRPKLSTIEQRPEYNIVNPNELASGLSSTASGQESRGRPVRCLACIKLLVLFVQHHEYVFGTDRFGYPGLRLLKQCFRRQ
jgi:hypothetical protein